MVGVLAMLSVGPNIWIIMALAPGVMSPHFPIEYRTHFTNFHQLVVGGIGSTEQLCIVISVTMSAFFHPSGYAYFLEELPYVGITMRDIVVWGSLISGVHYNLENLIYGYLAAKDKVYAIKCMVPYAQFFVMLWCSQWSRFWEMHALHFVVICGLFLLYANAIFNLSSTASMQYSWFFFEPFVFIALTAIDGGEVITSQ